MEINAFLTENGFTSEEIAGMSDKQKKVFAVALGKYEEGSSALTKSAAELESAKSEREEAAKFWEEKVTPALAGTDAKIAAANSEAARYKTYLQELKDKGYEVPDSVLPAAAKKEPVQDHATGRFVTPDQMSKEFSAVPNTMVALYTLGAEYQDLYGQPYLNGPTDFEEAKKSRKPLTDFVRDKYKFADKKSEREAAALQKKMDEHAAAKVAEAQAKWTETHGSNPETRAPLASKFDKIEKIAERSKNDSWKTSAGRDAARKDRLKRFEKAPLVQ